MLSKIFGKKSPAPLKKRDLVAIDIDHLRPTQLCLGMIEVGYHKKRLQEYVPRGSEVLKTYLQEEFGNVVLAPENGVYLIDGHHFARALYELGLKEMYVVVKKNWSDRKDKKFWRKMEGRDFIYLRDGLDKKREMADLPKHIRDLQDDPYRSLAWLIRKIGVYRNTDEPFQEFRWAQFFREQDIRLATPCSPDDLKAAAALAIELARKKKADHLPGFQSLKKSSTGVFLARLDHLLAM